MREKQLNLSPSPGDEVKTTTDACRTMMRMGEDDPSTHRPGDDAMSCAQIFAELQTMQGVGVSGATQAKKY